MALALDVVENRNLGCSTEDAKSPLDVLGKAAFVVPALYSYFGLVDLTRTRKHQIGHDLLPYVMSVCLAKKREITEHRAVVEAHKRHHGRHVITREHAHRIVKDQYVDGVHGRAGSDPLPLKANGANPHIPEVV